MLTSNWQEISFLKEYETHVLFWVPNNLGPFAGEDEDIKYLEKISKLRGSLFRFSVHGIEMQTAKEGKRQTSEGKEENV